jgi:hypothetical protein
MFSIYLILPAALGPGIYLASNINEYQKVKRGLILLLSVSPLFRQCEIISQLYLLLGYG